MTEQNKAGGKRAGVMKKWLMVIGFWAVILLPNLIYTAVKQRFSEVNQENRSLAEMPPFSLYPFEFHPGEIEDYINDHAAFRDHFISIYAVGNLELFRDIESSSVIQGKDGWLFFADGESLPDYLRINRYTSQELEAICHKVNEAEQYYADRGMEFLILLAPNKEGIYSRYMPEWYIRMPGPSRMEQLADYLRKYSDATIITPQEELTEQAMHGQPLYYKTDTHWNAAGAYTAAQQVIAALGGTPVSLKEVDLSYKEQAPGDLARLTHLPDPYVQDSEAVIRGYRDDALVIDTFADQFRYQVETENQNAADSRHLAVCADSFAGAMMPFLESYFAKTSVYHYSVYDGDRVDEREADIVLYEVVERQLPRITWDLGRMMGEEGAGILNMP